MLVIINMIMYSSSSSFNGTPHRALERISVKAPGWPRPPQVRHGFCLVHSFMPHALADATTVVSGWPSLTQPKANIPRQYGTKLLHRRPIPEQPQLSTVGVAFPPRGTCKAAWDAV